MKKILITMLIGGLFPFLLTAQSTVKNPLKGTWKLTKTQWGKMKKAKVPKREIYKIFTDHHYFFVYFNDKKTTGAGGGTYTIDDQTFTETVDYFSWDVTAVGTQQTFNWTIEGNQLHQSGKIKKTKKYDNYVIEEFYERVESIPNQAETPLAGVWRVEQSTYGESTMTAEESGLKIQKVFTAKYWCSVYTDKQTKKFKGLGFGTYELKGNQYMETIDAYSWDKSAVGKTVQFTMDIQPTSLVQYGVLNTNKYKDYVIREKFRRVE